MKKQLFRRCSAAVITVMMLFTSMIPTFAKGTDVGVVSYGLLVLSEQTDVAVWTHVGNEAVFSSDVIAKGLNLSKVRSITVTEIPTAATGELLLGSSRITAGQTVSAANLSYMTFSPADDSVAVGSFRFSVNEDSTPVICNVYFLAEKNVCPSVASAPALVLQASTYREMTVSGKMWGVDSDGDSLCFEITSYPSKGYLNVTDVQTGTYRYKPNDSYVGKDSFSYVVRDKYGNYSSSATVSLNVEQSGTGIQYADMANSKSAVAAISLTEAGIMSGQQIGENHYFYPAESVSRVEFLLMSMRAAGITEIPPTDQTVFADDSTIPDPMKGFVSAAYTLHYIDGTLSDDGSLCFLPNDPINRGEASVMVQKILKIKDENSAISVFSDGEEIPTWASDAMNTLLKVGILNPEDNRADANTVLNREDAASILSSVIKYLSVCD